MCTQFFFVVLRSEVIVPCDQVWSNHLLLGVVIFIASLQSAVSPPRGNSLNYKEDVPYFVCFFGHLFDGQWSRQMIKSFLIASRLLRNEFNWWLFSHHLDFSFCPCIIHPQTSNPDRRSRYVVFQDRLSWEERIWVIQFILVSVKDN